MGYRVTVTPAALAVAGEVGSSVLLHTHLHVREDALTLFGFPTADERDCFEALIGAHGVGPALALAILSTYAPAELRRVVAEGDAGSLTLVPGVGPKTAARLMIELRARLDRDDLADEVSGSGAEARAALSALGYSDDEIRRVMPDLPSEGEVHELLRAALKLIAAHR